VAQSLVSTGLAKAGYTIVWLDFGWASGARDGNGSLTVDTTQWPDGLSALTSYLHGLGLQAGIYTDAGTSGCSGQGVGSYGHYQQDADQFAAWGFDAVKVDFCGAGQQWLDMSPMDPRTLYAQFSNALANAGRPMILNVANFWTPGQINGSVPSLSMLRFVVDSERGSLPRISGAATIAHIENCDCASVSVIPSPGPR